MNIQATIFILSVIASIFVAIHLWGDTIKYHFKTFKIWHYFIALLLSSVAYYFMFSQVKRFLYYLPFSAKIYLGSGALLIGFGLVLFYKINWKNIKNELGIKPGNKKEE